MKKVNRAPIEQKSSSLGISEALQNDNYYRNHGTEASSSSHADIRTNGRRRRSHRHSQQEIGLFDHSTIMTDAMFKKIPAQQKGSRSLYIWARFYVSLYYNKLAVNMFGFLTGWTWYNKIDDYVILGALPTPFQVKTLHQQENVETIINLCAEFPGYEKLYRELGIDQIRLETPDFAIPNLDTLHEGIEKMVEMKKRKPNRMIYLHCKAGRGRSAALAICYLLRTYQLNLHECQILLLNRRPQVDTVLEQSNEIRLFSKDVIADAESGRINRIPYAMSGNK